MVKVKSFGLRYTQPLSIANSGEYTLDIIQFSFLSDVKLVYQDRCAGIAVS